MWNNLRFDYAYMPFSQDLVMQTSFRFNSNFEFIGSSSTSGYLHCECLFQEICFQWIYQHRELTSFFCIYSAELVWFHPVFLLFKYSRESENLPLLLVVVPNLLLVTQLRFRILSLDWFIVLSEM
jgi:hypothetical protein